MINIAPEAPMVVIYFLLFFDCSVTTKQKTMRCVMLLFHLNDTENIVTMMHWACNVVCIFYYFLYNYFIILYEKAISIVNRSMTMTHHLQRKIFIRPKVRPPTGKARTLSKVGKLQDGVFSLS
jgi:hypothetical protein